VNRVAIYTDGACSGNGSGDARGGWAAILVHASNERELSVAESNVTNQRMELRAAIEGVGARTRSSRCGEFVFVNQTAEQIAPVDVE
jgi:ribonuclease HI